MIEDKEKILLENLDDDIDENFTYDNVGGRIYGSNYEEQINILQQEFGPEDVTMVGSTINVYKFRKVSGIVRLTNEGEKSIKYSNDRFFQSTNIYIGKNPVVVVWDNSTTAYVNEKDKIIKEMKVGTYYKLYFESPKENTLVVDNINILGKDYVNTYIERDIKLWSRDWNPSDDDILEYVYLILDKTNQSKQWLEIQSTNPKYNEQTKKFERCDITFQNVNLKYSKTGKTLIDFMQLGAIGEGFAFPKETIDEKTGQTIVSLDEEFKLRKNDGVNQLQFDFNGGVGNSSFIFWGRPKEKLLEDGTIELEKPKILFPYKANFPKSSEFFYNKPNMNSYYGTNWLPVKNEIWVSYRESYKNNDNLGDFNVDKEKQVLVGFKHDVQKVRNTNPNLNTYTNWNNDRNINIDLDFLNLKPIPYLVDIDRINKQATYCEFFTINAFLNWYTDVFNYDYNETIKYKLTDVLGILGGIVNILVNGLDIGWTSNSTLGPKQPINFLLPCISFEDGKAALSDVAPLPCDIFIDSNAKKILPTATNILTSWNFQLTDRFIDSEMVIEGAEVGKGGNGVWNTKYLGQTKDEDGNYLLPSKKPVELNLNTFRLISPSTTTNDWIIDYLDFKTIGICDYRISAYNNADENVYSVYLETNAKARDEITIWGNTLKFNYYEEFNTIGKAKWPENVKIPKPIVENVGLKLIELEEYAFASFKFPETVYNNTNPNINFRIKETINKRQEIGPSGYINTYFTYYYTTERELIPNLDGNKVSFSLNNVSNELSINLDNYNVDLLNYKGLFIKFWNENTLTLNFGDDCISREEQQIQNFELVEKFSSTINLQKYSSNKGVIKYVSEKIKYVFSTRKEEPNTLIFNFSLYFGYDNSRQYLELVSSSLPNETSETRKRFYIDKNNWGSLYQQNIFSIEKIKEAYLIPKIS